jgi:hypothetical protein
LSHHQGLAAAANLPPSPRRAPKSVAMRLSYPSQEPIVHTYVERRHAHQSHRRRRAPPQDVPELQPISPASSCRHRLTVLPEARIHQLLWMLLPPYPPNQGHLNLHCRHERSLAWMLHNFRAESSGGFLRYPDCTHDTSFSLFPLQAPKTNLPYDASHSLFRCRKPILSLS